MYMYASCLNEVLKVCNIQRTPVSVNRDFNLTSRGAKTEK